MKFRMLATLVFAGSTIVSSAALAEVVTLKAELSGKHEVPPHAGTAKGQAEGVLDTDTLTLTWNVTYEGLTGPAIGAHIHGPVSPGNNAGILIPFPSTDSPITGSQTITQDQSDDILNGMTYVNVHTQAHPGGEIRGQLEK